jgi:hypothetical protein
MCLEYNVNINLRRHKKNFRLFKDAFSITEITVGSAEGNGRKKETSSGKN